MSASPASILCISLFEDHVNVFPRRFLQSLALSGSQISAKYTWSKTFRDTCNASGKNGSRLSISNSFLHDHGLREIYRIELFVRHSEANCGKAGIVVN